MELKVHCDATCKDGVTGIGIVLFRNDKPIRCHYAFRIIDASDTAERAAVQLARERYPDVPVFTDSTSAADVHGVNWIPREENSHAHRAAHEAYERQMNGSKTYRKSLRKRFLVGRGCIAWGHVKMNLQPE